MPELVCKKKKKQKKLLKAALFCALLYKPSLANYNMIRWETTRPYYTITETT